MNDINEKLAEAMGYKFWLETRGSRDVYTLAVYQTPNGRKPWEGYKNPDLSKYKECTASEAYDKGFFTKAPVDYRDSAIFAECVKWLLDNGYTIKRTSFYSGELEYIVFNGKPRQPDIKDKDLFKAAALAVIAAKEVG